MIPGTFPLLGGGSGKQADFLGSRTNSTNAGSFSFSNVPLGISDPTRVIVLAVGWYEYDTSASITSFTVAGASTTSRVSASLLVTGGSGSYVYSNIRTCVPSGTTGTVSISFNRAIDFGVTIGLWALYNVASATPVDISATSSGSFSGLTANAGDLLIASSNYVYDGSQTSWSGATENFDVARNRMVTSGAQREILTAGSVAVSFSGNPSVGGYVGVAGVWR